jgi:hypothetical protein
MVEALRRGSISMVNALGSGILETRAFSAFMPRIARSLLGGPLALPEIATWWCGQRGERSHVLQTFDHMMIGPAFSTSLPFDDLRGTALGSSVPADQRDQLRARIEAHGYDYVGQEPVRLSTAPVYIDGRLKPRPITLRVYAARTAHGWTVMPGGFARVGSSNDTSAIAMQRGGQAADVWVISSKPVERVSLLPQDGDKLVRNPPGNLPSRAADNLDLARGATPSAAKLACASCAPTMPALPSCRAPTFLCSRTRAPISKPSMSIAAEGLPIGLLPQHRQRRSRASQIRDRFSPDGWLALNDLQKSATLLAPRCNLATTPAAP